MVARWTRQELDRPTTLYYKMQAYRASENSRSAWAKGFRRKSRCSNQISRPLWIVFLDRLQQTVIRY